MSIGSVDFDWSARRRRNGVDRGSGRDFARRPSDIQGSTGNRTRDSNFDRQREMRVLDFGSGDLEVSDFTGSPIDDDASHVKCVMLIAPDEHPPQQLLDLLRQPEESAFERAEHPLLAVARLATLERARRMRAEWTPDLEERSVLVVVNRDAWRDLSPLFQTIRQVMPSVGIWVCTERVAIEVHAGQNIDGLEGPPSETPPPAPESVAPDEDEPSDRSDRTALSDAEMRDLLDLFSGDDLDDPPSLGLSGRDEPS